jgi:hypothetical protein
MLGVDFRGSVDLVLPEGIEWDVSGTKLNLVMYFLFYILYYFYVYKEGSKDVLFHHADRGTSRPTEMSTLGHRGDVQIVWSMRWQWEDFGRSRGTSEV